MGKLEIKRSLKMFPRGCNRETISYVERPGWGIMKILIIVIFYQIAISGYVQGK